MFKYYEHLRLLKWRRRRKKKKKLRTIHLVPVQVKMRLSKLSVNVWRKRKTSLISIIKETFFSVASLKYYHQRFFLLGNYSIVFIWNVYKMKLQKKQKTIAKIIGWSDNMCFKLNYIWILFVWVLRRLRTIMSWLQHLVIYSKN